MPAPIYIVQAVHPKTPGSPMTAHATIWGAVAEAASLVRLMPGAPAATAANWEEKLGELQAEYGESECDVWITKLDLGL